MKIVFINPSHNTVKASKFPIGMAYITSCLKEFGYSDIFGFYSTDLEWKNQIKDANVLGIHVTFKSVTESLDVAREAKKVNPKIIIIPGGPQVTLNPEVFLKTGLFDAVIIGEGEDTFIELIDNINKINGVPDNTTMSRIEGLAYNCHDQIIFSKPRDRRINLDSIPFPDRNLFRDSIHSFLWYKSTDFLAGRSCIYNCTNCQPALKLIMGNYRIRSVQNVISEIEFLKKEYKVNSLHFNDNSLTHNKKWVEDFCNELIKRKIHIEWSCSVCEHEVNEKILSLMAQAGCKRISFGIESGSPRVLKEVLNKRVNLDHAREVIIWCTNHRIATHAYFMMAIPGETKEEAIETVDFATNIEVNSLQFTISSPNPCTGYEKIANERGWNKSKSYDTIVNNDRTPPIITEEYGPEFIKELDEKIIRSFIKKGWECDQDESILYFKNIRKDFKEHPAKTIANYFYRIIVSKTR